MITFILEIARPGRHGRELLELRLAADSRAER